MIQSGEILGGTYQIIREIGHGGTGIIYLAEHLRLQKKVVVKKIKDHFVGQVNGRAEVDILKRLHHTCLPQVYDFLVIGSSVYTIMEYVEGYDLQQYLDQGYQFPEQTIRQWLLQLSEVLEYLHTQNPPILHSDIKPANLMITPQGTICLIDFNISLDGGNTKDVQGISPWYAAPEQYEEVQNILYGRESRIVLDGRMDIYSLGATFYRVMTGLLPSPEGASDILDMDIPYSEGLKAVISKSMKRKPSARFQTAKQMKKALTDIGRMDPVYKRYGRLQIAGGLVWILCVVTGVLCLYYGNWKNGVEKWQQAYRELYVYAQTQNETEIVSKATEMLNDSTYKSYLKKHEEKRADVLHTLGESYYRQEMFDEAAACYQEAWELEPQEGGFCKDYVIALVRAGKLSRAGQVIRSAQGLEHLSQEEQKLIQAEIDWMNQDTESALAALEELTGTSGTAAAEREVLQDAWLLLAEIYESSSDYENAAKALESAGQILSSKEILRKLGQTAVKAASESKQPTVQNAYLQKALACYELLNQSSSPSYNDRLNLALTERASGEYDRSNQTLQAMEKEYPDDYVIKMWICYNYLGLSEENRESKSLMEDLRFTYKDGKHCYDLSGETNEDMEQLIEIMNGLGE